ncbi:MAG: DUF1080 domain-containing protein [Verrucomicrobiales bacterium]|nr:DUF1080 domain-containing protein [Verrucomicrobiales bacterium]
MKKHLAFTLTGIGAALLAITALPFRPVQAEEAKQAADDGFIAIFDPAEKFETHWDGDPRFWKVAEGCIVGQTTAENPTKGNTFLTWKDGELDDFELLADFKIEGGNSGIQVRSFAVPDSPWVVGGYQADFDAGNSYTGIVYGERFRGILANRGTKSVIGDDSKPVEERFAKNEDLKDVHKTGQWNTMRVVCKGWTMTNYMNGVMTAQVTDNDKKNRRRSGILALQLHAGPPMKVQFKNIKLKRLPLGDVKKVVLAAGNPSHGPGEHEHRAGCLLIAKALNDSFSDKVLATVYTGGFPKDPTALANADALVMYCDGGGGHPANSRLKIIDAAVQHGMGVGAIHYGVETIAGDPGNAFLKWMGGFFEINWSVNPHWDAAFDKLPAHAVTRGVKPFTIHDEWYYHMRFRPDMKGVTPILSALPPKDTLNRPDGSHSGNPAVREAVAKGQPQTTMWISENEGGSRGFGFTGGHFHRNWKDENFRKVVLNAIAWIAKAEIPADGVPSITADDAGMQANLDKKGR